MQILINPINVTLKKSQHELAGLLSGTVFDAVTLDGGDTVGYLLLEAGEVHNRICMKLKDQIGYVTFNGHQTTRGAIDTLATELNLAVNWKALNSEPWLAECEETNGWL